MKEPIENTSFNFGDTTINTIVNASTAIAVQFQFDAPTFQECWNVIYAKKIVKKTAGTQRSYRSAYKRFSSLYERKINTITLRDLQPIFDNAMKLGASRSLLCTMKCILNYIYDYALKYDYAFKRYPDYIEWEATVQGVIEHKPFTKEEIVKIYEASNNSRLCELVLIYIYTGMRPMELINMTSENVHLDDNYMVGGLKTNAGRNRIIPIHPLIKPYIIHLLERNKRYLLSNICDRHGVNNYRESMFYPVMEILGMDHYPYDTRHTFATLCNEYHVDDYAIKKMMGHSCNDITKDVYTHAYLDYLQEQIRKLPRPDKLTKKSIWKKFFEEI